MRTGRATNDRRDLERLLDSVGRRLLARRMAALASRNLLAAMLLMLVPAAYSAFRPASNLGPAGAVLGFIAIAAAAGQALASRPDRVAAALHVDARFDLGERLSTLVALPEARGDAFFEAFAANAFARARAITPGAACPIPLPRSAPFTGAVLFCVAALIVGTAQKGSADRAPGYRSEIRDILNAGGSLVQVEMTPEMREELRKLAPPQDPDNLAEAMLRLDSLLSKLEALKGIRDSARKPEAAGLTAEDIAKAVAEGQDARARLQQALARAAAMKDEALQKAAEAALEALEAGDEQALAAALDKVMAQLAAETAGHELQRLAALKAKLAPAEGAPGPDGGVGRGVKSGSPDGIDGSGRAGAPAFPEQALLRAKAAVSSGEVPVRYRWVIERYFTPDKLARP